jgi:protein gp37
LSSTEQAALLALRHQPTTKRFNEQKGQDNIEWARWSWNPVTGCKHNCIYCYARDIAERFYPQKFEPSIIPERLAVPYTQQPPEGGGPGYRNVFTCSMADLWGRWVPQAWIDAVLATVTENPQWNFLMLTKFPGRMAEQAWPVNAWVGTSVDTQARVAAAEKAFANVKAGVKWLSCEPMLEPLKFSSLAMFDWVVIGGQTRSTQAPEFQPKWEWIEDLLWQARKAGCKVYFKTNLLNRPREYPE